MTTMNYKKTINNKMHESINRFIKPRSIAVLGASDNYNKFGYTAYRELKERGYSLYPISSFRKTIDGDFCFNSINELPQGVENLLIILPPELAKKIVMEIDPIIIKSVWLQNGAESAQAVRMCLEKGIDVIFRKCILMYATPVRSYHLLHRLWFRLKGKL